MSEPAEFKHFPSDLAGGSVGDSAGILFAAGSRSPAALDIERQVALYDTPMSAARRAEAAVEQPLARQVTSQAGAGPVAAAEPATGVCGAAPGDASGVDSSAAEAAESTGIEQAGIVAAGPVRPAGEVETGQAGQADATEPAWEADPGRVPAEPQSVDDWLDDAVDGSVAAAAEAADWVDPEAQRPPEPAAEPAGDGSPGDRLAAGQEEQHAGPVFSLQMEDVAATAGEFVRDAGDFARQAWQRFGRFASGVRGETLPADEMTSDAQAARPAGSRGVERLVLRSVGRRVRLVSDSRVPTITADGPHTLRRHGAILEVNTEGEVGLNFDGFSMVRPPRSVDDLRTLGLGRELVVRVNPAILVDAEVTGSRLTTVGLPYLGRVRVTAGGLNMSGVREVAEVLIQVGGAVLSGPLSSGRSTVHVESGNLSVRLDADASVTVRAQTQLGVVSWPGGIRGDVTEYAVGDGTGRLELGVVMGRAVVRFAE